MTKYYTKQQLEQLGILGSSIEVLRRKFKGTKFVEEPRPRLYSEDFLRYAQARQGKTGPANLPDTDRIVALYELAGKGLSVEGIAKYLCEDEAVIEAQLKTLGLED